MPCQLTWSAPWSLQDLSDRIFTSREKNFGFLIGWKYVDYDFLGIKLKITNSTAICLKKTAGLMKLKFLRKIIKIAQKCSLKNPKCFLIIAMHEFINKIGQILI